MSKVELNKTLTITIGKKVIIENLDTFKVIRNIDNFENCCDLIYQLKVNNIGYINNDTLYEIASIIENEFDSHNINWFNTFMVIEKENYAKHLRAEEQDDIGVDVFYNIDAAIDYNEEINEEISKPGLSNALRENVADKLKSYKLL